MASCDWTDSANASATGQSFQKYLVLIFANSYTINPPERAYVYERNSVYLFTALILQYL